LQTSMLGVNHFPHLRSKTLSLGLIQVNKCKVWNPIGAFSRLDISSSEVQGIVDKRGYKM
jgi:hypothetical protein